MNDQSRTEAPPDADDLAAPDDQAPPEEWDGASQAAQQPRRFPSGARTLPRNLAAEEAVLGSMMLSPDAIGTVNKKLDAAHFYHKPNAYIFDAIVSLYSDGTPIDGVTVAEELQRHNLLRQAGGEERLLALQAATPVTTNAERYAGIVEENALLRGLIAVSNEISDLGYNLGYNKDDEDWKKDKPPKGIDEVLDEAESKIYALSQRRIINSTSHLKPLLEEAFEHLNDIYNSGGGVTGVPTGFVDLDELLGGLQPSTLNVVGARPSVGKTAFGLTIASHVAVTAQKPVLFFSLEMAHLELSSRLLAADARIDSHDLQTGNLQRDDWAKIGNSIERLGQAQMWIDTNPNLTVNEIRTKARRLYRQVGELGLIVVDYLQLMTQPGKRNESRQVEVADMSRGLKVLARELSTPVLALSQLSRTLEQRSDKRPMLSDLRESGAIEQDADVVMFLYRDEVYNPDSDQKGNAEVHISKHRNGPTGKVDLAFLPKHACFANATNVESDY